VKEQSPKMLPESLTPFFFFLEKARECILIRTDPCWVLGVWNLGGIYSFVSRQSVILDSKRIEVFSALVTKEPRIWPPWKSHTWVKLLFEREKSRVGDGELSCFLQVQAQGSFGAYTQTCEAKSSLYNVIIYGWLETCLRRIKCDVWPEKLYVI
jgi:hypothetical protein